MLQFKDIKQNYPVYMFDKQELTYVQGKVTSVTFPRFDMNASKMSTPGQMPIPGQSQMVVDVTIEANDKTATYVIPENLSLTGSGNLIISTEKEILMKEIEAIKTSSEQALSSMDYHKKVIEKTTALLSELNPVYKKEKETEERFNKIEDSVSRMEKMMTKFFEEFNK